MTLLSAKPCDNLDWKIEGTPSVFEFDLGFNEPYFPLEDELHFQSLCVGLGHFTKEVWPKFPQSRAVLYRGPADFSSFFRWTEQQEQNFKVWKEERPETSEEHLKRLFCAEAFVAYFQMLAHRLPDELPLSLIVEPKNTGSVSQTLHLLSPERFEHFFLETGLEFTSSIGVCFPTDERCGDKVLKRIDSLLPKLDSFKPVYETLLTEQWDGLDEIYVLADTLTAQGKRKLMGFLAAGGIIREA